MAKLSSPGTWPSDLAVGAIFLGGVGLITIVMLALVVLRAAGTL